MYYTVYKGDDIMSISKDNTRMILTIPKELKAELEKNCSGAKSERK